MGIRSTTIAKERSLRREGVVRHRTLELLKFRVTLYHCQQGVMKAYPQTDTFCGRHATKLTVFMNIITDELEYVANTSENP